MQPSPVFLILCAAAFVLLATMHAVASKDEFGFPVGMMSDGIRILSAIMVFCGAVVTFDPLRSRVKYISILAGAVSSMAIVIIMECLIWVVKLVL